MLPAKPAPPVCRAPLGGHRLIVRVLAHRHCVHCVPVGQAETCVHLGLRLVATKKGKKKKSHQHPLDDLTRRCFSVVVMYILSAVNVQHLFSALKQLENIIKGPGSGYTETQMQNKF